MKVQVRQNVFETNSSSTHSFTLSENSETLTGKIYPNMGDDGLLVLGNGEYGWGYDEYNDSYTKADYLSLCTYGNSDKMDILKSVLSEVSGIPIDKIILENNGYIDHQSHGNLSELFNSESLLKNFIFNIQSQLIIDNDNH